MRPLGGPIRICAPLMCIFAPKIVVWMNNMITCQTIQTNLWHYTYQLMITPPKSNIAPRNNGWKKKSFPFGANGLFSGAKFRLLNFGGSSYLQGSVPRSPSWKALLHAHDRNAWDPSIRSRSGRWYLMPKIRKMFPCFGPPKKGVVCVYIICIYIHIKDMYIYVLNINNTVCTYHVSL